jgi:hypothetical protein
MRYFKGALLGVLVVATIATAAALVAPQRPPKGKGPESFPPSIGTAYFDLDFAPGALPGSLDQLIENSSLIVDGYVQSVIPPWVEVEGQFLNTDVIVLVTRILKGTLPEKQIVVSQIGGTLGQFTQVPSQYTVMQQGEHVVLFLAPDVRANTPVHAEIPRFAIRGEFVGLFRERDGKVQLSKGTPAGLREKYDGMDLQQVLSDVAARVSAGR